MTGRILAAGIAGRQAGSDGREDMHEAVEAAWQAVMSERSRLGAFDLREAFAADPGRAARYRVTAAGLELDYSRNLLDERALAMLLRLAAQSGALDALRAQAAGALANPTEGRAALHTALRDTPAPLQPGVTAEVKGSRVRMAQMADELRSGRWSGWSGQSIGAVVNIGIGGSHLGPCVVADALSHLRTPGLSMHFVSNVDPRDLEDTLESLDPRRTLFVVASKTFGTLETLENACAARRWLLAAGCPESALTRHLAAVSANVPRAVAFGVAEQNVLPMWDWVGGRFSVWSAIGLPLALGLGMETFEALLAGARAMDAHALEAEAEGNMPLVLALLSVWYRNAWGFASQAVIPYEQRLARLPEFLQQLVMESNGKSVDREGRALGRDSSGVLWGTAGTNGQHSFHQMLHQGSTPVPVDFVLPLGTHARNRDQHAHLVANGIAQARALMIGRSLAESRAELLARGLDEAQSRALAPHLVMPGNRPSNTISMHCLTPETLGALIALYEHRTALEGYLWGLNSFDQYGVELGKRIGESVHRALRGDAAELASLDPSSAAAVTAWRALNA